MTDSLSSTVRLTKTRKSEARSAANQPKDLVTKQFRRSRGDAGDAITQEGSFSARDSPFSSIISHAKMPRGTEESQEEQDALLRNVDPDEDSLSSNRTSLPSTKTSRSTLADSFLQAEVDADDDTDLETALEIRRRVAPDQFAKGYETTKWEIWAYYGYYIGNNALTLAIFAPMAMQNLISRAAGGEKGVLPFLGR